MEYGEAINRSSAEGAFALALQRLREGNATLREAAAEAVARVYCTCVTYGEDAAERALSNIHADLVAEIEKRLRSLIYGEDCH